MRTPSFLIIRELWPRDGEAPPPPAAPPETPPPAGLLNGQVPPPPAPPNGAPPAAPPAAPPNGAPPAAPPPVEILDKFKVLDATGGVDHKATLAKYHASYAALEKRVGTGDLPPADASGYTIDPKHELPPEQEQAIRAKFHAGRFTAAQANEALEIYNELIEGAVKTQEMETVNAIAALKAEWGPDYQTKLNSANYALAVIGGAELAQEIASNPELSNNATVLRLMAKAAEYVREDRTADAITSGETDELNSLVRSPAYTDTAHPDHHRTVTKVRAGMQRGWKPTF